MGAQAHGTTRSARPGERTPHWYLVDASDQVLGRLATRLATVLRGKHHALFTPHVDTGDFIVVVNAEKVKLTGRKRDHKVYYRHTGWTGHVKSVTAGEVLDSAHPERVLERAVRLMLPKNALGRRMFAKLKVYGGPRHPHAAQKPEEMRLA
ncbi:MAG TPA: 50S ribosomal protein L13 [Myxococcota bacterium]|nr:50S ribosomal protein L13 [Myxococcota bacterium]